MLEKNGVEGTKSADSETPVMCYLHTFFQQHQHRDTNITDIFMGIYKKILRSLTVKRKQKISDSERIVTLFFATSCEE